MDGEITDLAPITSTNPLALDPQIRSHLSSWEDYKGYYVQLEEASNSVSWIKADLLADLVDKFGPDSIDKFAGEINQKGSTVRNYVRVSKAFPPERRLEDATFSLHFQASFSDSYDGQGNFDGEKRFEWVEKAAAEGFATRRLKMEIDKEKEREKLGVPVIPCYRCGTTDGEILRCVLYIFGEKTRADRFDLCRNCHKATKEFATAKIPSQKVENGD